MTTETRWPRAAEAITAAVAKPIQKVRDRFSQGETVITPAAEAWRLWRHVGELHYATTFMARQVSRLAWDVIIDGEKLERPKHKPWPDILDQATFPTGVRNITQQMTLNYLVPGAFYYLQDPFNVWEVAATTRPKLNELIELSAHAIHAINPDPEQPGRPDSPVLANMDTIRELVLLQALQRSQSRLRIAQRGVLLYPAEAEFAEGINFEEDFQAAATEPIKDEFAASAVSPLILKFPEALIEKWRHLVLESPYDEELTAKIESVTRRLAIGLDMPPEALLGMGDATHWTVWNVSESTYRAHMEPWAVDVGKVLARAIHRIRGDEAEVEVPPDPTPVLAKLGSVTDGLEAFDRGIVNAKFVRGLMGADEDDAPPAESIDDTARVLSQQEAVQKVYLGVTNDVITRDEARQMINDAGGHLETTASAETPNGENNEPTPQPRLSIRRLSSDRVGPPAERPTTPTPG